MMLDAAIYEGALTHARTTPKAHRFDYNFATFYCDLEEIPALCARSQLLSYERFNWVSYHRHDYLPSSRTLRDEVIHQIKEKTGVMFNGQIALLANWRSFGTLINPIALFYCFSRWSLDSGGGGSAQHTLE